MAAIRGVLFDWGDTLFSPPDAGQVIVTVARERGVRIEPVEARALWDELWEAGKTPEELAKGRDLSADAHREVWTALFERAHGRVPGIARDLYERVMDPRAWIPYPDTAPTLRALRERDAKIGIVSNVPRDLRPIFAAAGLAELVDAFTHSFEVGAEKPDPAIFRKACERLGTRPQETLMVGDHALADGGAVKAGLRFHLLPPDAAPDRPRGLGRVVAIVDASREAR
ncbi:MAG TPA: HAD-IA family hydrolase [Candidatus Limnocylindria bacterium]|nr:HAD-IA family hydrolase [Candidatus Limnocylindria bacterium]